MKGLTRVVLGSIAGGFLSAAAFFVVDGLLPKPAGAQLSTPGLPGYVHDKSILGF